MRVVARGISQILIGATSSPIEDLFGVSFIVVAVRMVRGMHCSKNDGFPTTWVQVSCESVVVRIGVGLLVV